VKDQLKAKGARGFIGIGQLLRLADEDHDGKLSLGEFKRVLRDCDLSLGESDTRLLFSHFDRDGSELIPYQDFLHDVRGEMSSKRLTLVKLAFQRLDTDGSGLVSPEEIANRFDASKHPEVLAGRLTVNYVLKVTKRVVKGRGVVMTSIGMYSSVYALAPLSDHVAHRNTPGGDLCVYSLCCDNRISWRRLTHHKMGRSLWRTLWNIMRMFLVALTSMTILSW